MAKVSKMAKIKKQKAKNNKKQVGLITGLIPKST